MFIFRFFQNDFDHRRSLFQLLLKQNSRLEGNEPPHVHVEREDKTAKLWLKPVKLASSYGFRSHELTEIRALVVEYSTEFLEKWYEHFSR